MASKTSIPEAEDVRIRFIQSFEILKKLGRVKWKIDFCSAVGLGAKATTNLNQMEAGLREPRVSHILLLHKKYGVSLDWLMFGKGDFLSENQEKNV
jgi:transcriptional regulator with XRE-family HTH domain